MVSGKRCKRFLQVISDDNLWHEGKYVDLKCGYYPKLIIEMGVDLIKFFDIITHISLVQHFDDI